MFISLCTLALTACGIAGRGAGPSSVVHADARGDQLDVRGSVFSAHQPVIGASVQFYVAGSTAVGSGSVAMLPKPVKTDSSGSFSVAASQLGCRSTADLVYVVSTGGAPRAASSGENRAAGSMAALGACSTLSASSFVQLNELTTVASVWSLSPFMSFGATVGADPQHHADLVQAFEEVGQLIDVQTSAVPGPHVETGWEVPVENINTLGNVLSVCGEANGASAREATPCGHLLSLAKLPPNTTAPNVLDAALAIATHPTKHVEEIFELSPAEGPWKPELAAAPSDWTLALTPTPNAAATAAGGTSSVADAVQTGVHALRKKPTEVPPAKLAFAAQPLSTSVGSPLASPVSVVVQDASGNVLPSATNPVTLTLVGGSTPAILNNSSVAAGSLTAASSALAVISGPTVSAAVAGQAAFSNLSIAKPGENYTIVASSPGLASATSSAFSVLPLMTGTSFAPPPANSCNSPFDKFYMAEPGVYAFWPLCEQSSSGVPAFFDYLNRYDWNPATGSWSSGSGTVTGGAAGPVADGETAARISTQYAFIANQDLVLNSRAGTLAVWANTDADQNRQGLVRLQAVGGNSKIWINTIIQGGSECFEGQWTNAAGTDAYTTRACGYGINTWHRLALTWSAGALTLYVDGLPKAAGTYTGTLDNMVFYYSLFPQSYDNLKQTTLAKVTLSNQAWTAAESTADNAPTFPSIPAGGVLVSVAKLGAIHKDVLGAVDLRSTMTSPTQINGLKASYTTAGITSVRYANGSAGIWADLTNWNGGTTGPACGTNLNSQAVPGPTQASVNAASLDTTDTFIPQVAQPLGLSLGYTVNYGTNPPLCNAGGDPIVNGANLVRYLNVTKHYGFKYFEIGNELFDANAGGLEADFHVTPAPASASGATYGGFESTFYTSMKAVDPSILIGIPIGMNNVYGWLQNWSLPALSAATYDAVIYHDYPINDPVTDGSTLYPERIASNLDRSLGDLRSLQTMLLNAGRSPESIWVTEWSSMSHGGGMWTYQSTGATTPLYVTMRLAEYMNAGVQWATYFAQAGDSYCNPFNIDYQSGTVYNWAKTCSSSALVYPGAYPASVSEVNVGLKAGDAYPAGRGFQLLSQSGFVTEGEHMLKTYVDDVHSPWLAAYGATHGSSYALILVNRDRDNAHTVPVQIAGKTAGTGVQQWTYGRSQYDHSYFGNWSVAPAQSSQAGWSGTFPASLPPWSVSVFIFQ